MSRDLVKLHAARLERPGMTVRCVDNGETVIVILDSFAPPNGSSYTPSIMDAVAFVVPITYPDAEPDPTGFYVRPTSLRLIGGQQLRSASIAPLNGEQWLKLSWRRQAHAWDPNVDTLDGHLAIIEARFLKGE